MTNENRPMAGTIGLVGTSVDHSYRIFTSDLIQRQGTVFTERSVAQRDAELRAYRRRTVMQRAKTVLRSRGFLLHVAENGVERRLTLKQVWKGFPFLSVWVRDGMEVTFTRKRLDGFIERPVQPRGAGWEFHRDIRGENSSSWRRPVRVEDATTREATSFAERPPRMEGQ